VGMVIWVTWVSTRYLRDPHGSEWPHRTWLGRGDKIGSNDDLRTLNKSDGRPKAQDIRAVVADWACYYTYGNLGVEREHHISFLSQTMSTFAYKI